jgi:hypothetical protein
MIRFVKNEQRSGDRYSTWRSGKATDGVNPATAPAFCR